MDFGVILLIIGIAVMVGAVIFTFGFAIPKGNKIQKYGQNYNKNKYNRNNGSSSNEF